MTVEIANDQLDLACEIVHLEILNTVPLESINSPGWIQTGVDGHRVRLTQTGGLELEPVIATRAAEASDRARRFICCHCIDWHCHQKYRCGHRTRL